MATTFNATQGIEETATLNKQLYDKPSSGLNDRGKKHENYNSKKGSNVYETKKVG
jgi:hypothetical protein